MDQEHACAFRIFCATFVLSFHGTANDCVISPAMQEFLSSEKQKLEKLANRDHNKTNQLVCLLHGPGGSGKTAVTDLTIEYCREFCGYIEGFVFTTQTIVVTALSGVAATNLMGETTHQALYLNQQRRISPEQVQQWKGITRLVIIDEISFASTDLVLKIHKNLAILLQNCHAPNSGVEILFLGDFRQLHPVNVLSLYEEKNREFFD